MRTQTDRRRHTTPLRWPERRTGFDRRREYPVTGTLRTHGDMLILMLIVLNVLGVFDWVLTSSELSVLGASEANPIMSALFAMGPLYALALKVATLALVTAAVWMWRRYRAVLVVAVGAVAAYFLVIAYHLVGIATLA